MQVFYKPRDAWVGDFIPYFEDGEFKLFYLQQWRRNYREGLPRGWHLLGTRDFLSFKEYGACGIVGGTGSVLRAGNVNHLFYCQFPKGAQIVCHAVAPDLLHWTTIPSDSFEADPRLYERGDFRDPHVFWNEEAGEYWMLLASRVKGSSNRRGCVALYASSDLSRWEPRDPFYAPGIHVSAHECPDIFRMGSWWYLLYSAYTERFATYYRMSRSLSGPWLAAEEDTFDGRAWYAAKSASDGRRRYLFGWNPTREENEYNWRPPAYPGSDYSSWDWGGNLVVHELTQSADGSLGVTVPRTIDRALARPVPVTFTPVMGNWTVRPGTVEATRPDGYACILSEELPSQCRIGARIQFAAGTRSFGFMLRAGLSVDAAYYLRFEPARNRVLFRSGIMQDERGGKVLPYEVELERPIALAPDKSLSVTIIIEGSLCELYADQKVAMSSRIYDIQKGGWGLFVSHGSARFEEVSVSVF